MLRIGFSGVPGSGKAQPLWSKLLTPSGYIEMKDIKIGDTLINSNGEVCEVLNIFPQGKKDIYKITFSDYTEAFSTEDHLWIAKKSHNFKVVDLKYIKDDINNVNTCDRKWKIPLTKSIQFIKKELSIDPYLLGCLLGDGSFKHKSNIKISTHIDDYQIIEECKKVLPPNVKICKVGKKHDYDFRIKHIIKQPRIKNKFHNNLKKYIFELGLWQKGSHYKFIPEIYKYSSIEDRISILQGLMDTDGYVQKKYKTNNVIFYSTSKRLIEDVLFLINSLGGRGIIRNKKTKLNNKIFYSYLLDINLPKEIVPFRLERKRKIYETIVKYKPIRYIKSIEYYSNEEAQCIQVSSKDGSYLTDNMIVTHNTSTCRAVASFARTIQDINNIELVSEYARRQVAKYGPILDINQQFRILKKQLEWEDSVGNCDIVLTDAPIFLGYLYATKIHNKTVYDKDYYFYHDLFKEMSKLNSPRRYDIIFHLPPVIKPVNDGIRAEHEFDQGWRDKSDMFLNVIMSEIFPPRYFVVVEQQTLEDRMKFCLEYIQKVKKEI